MEHHHHNNTAKSDLEMIKQKVLGYVEAWYTGEPERGEKSLHPDLVKRIARMDSESGKPFLEMMSASKLADRWSSGDGKKTPKEQQIKEIAVLDVHGNMASVKLETAGWVDYMHLVKFNGEWVIVNILWEVKPVY
ncbi:MAG: nuclear transport factor 2 family protein [Proteobacteria bacterium]|nr:nuclear transport factor 2 family protein [Pseudomonadota bacterium]MBU4471871.1 nuclear transport factor 2 family protein [Pseudomonadota bacterium]MCG2751153.1 nuclear transport factor 2 family protein [Desulfobacteraceae bacterium]